MPRPRQAPPEWLGAVADLPIPDAEFLIKKGLDIIADRLDTTRSRYAMLPHHTKVSLSCIWFRQVNARRAELDWEAAEAAKRPTQTELFK